MLHVTNGDSAALTIGQAGHTPVLSWKDALHEGPVPAGAGLRQTRARFLSGCGWGTYDSILADMEERDQTLVSADRIVLWFEHDLYDQLQLIQILDMLECPAEMICTDRYVGCMHLPELAALWPNRQPVTEEQIAVARQAWQAFRSSSPDALKQLSGTACLPFLASALQRHLEDFPSDHDGLSRTERQILQAASDEPESFADLFQATQRMEAAIYMGDSLLQLHIDRLTECHHPLLSRNPIRLTETGREVLNGKANQIELNGIDRWLGGVHLRRPGILRSGFERPLPS